MGGDVEIDTYMVNFLIDYNIGKIKPYIGIGLGVADVDLATSVYGGANFQLSGSETLFAAQGIIGVSYEVHENVELFTDARYLVTEEGDFTRRSPVIGSSEQSSDFDAVSINVGLRYLF